MKCTTFAGIAVSLTIAGGVWAHSGATGVVKERMDGMMAMSEAIKSITPLMRGKTEYDAARVEAFAAVLKTHSGEAMTRLFPEGTGGKPSVAKPAVWENWQRFVALANRLDTLAEGLARAAGNGVASGMMGSNTMMGSGAGMMGTGSGGQAMMGGETMMGSGPGMSEPDLEQLAKMPADAVFQMVGQTCAACHTKFRAEK